MLIKTMDSNNLRELGYNYEHGIGVEKDEKKCFEYYMKAAELGNAVAIVNVGNCYQNGDGVEKDEKKAFEYYKKAADMDYDNGIFGVGICYFSGIGIETNYQ